MPAMALSPAQRKQVASAARAVLDVFHDTYDDHEDRLSQQECLKKATRAADRETNKLASQLEVSGDEIWREFNRRLYA